MHKKGYSYTSKHAEFVSFMRAMMVSAEQEGTSAAAMDNDDAENEVNTELMLKLERILDDLFDSPD